jgi:phenylalanine-4-hydroxylase
VLRTHYRIDDFQEMYHVLRHLDGLPGKLRKTWRSAKSCGPSPELARIDFTPCYRVLEDEPEYRPGDVAAGDEVITRGSGCYHAGRGSAGRAS